MHLVRTRSLLLVTYTVLLVFFLMNFGYIVGLVARFFTVFMPFIYGFAIAYVVNWPYEFFKTLLTHKKHKINSSQEKSAKFIAIIAAYFLVLGMFGFLLVAIIPQILLSLEQLFQNLPKYSDTFLSWAKEIENRLNINLISIDYTDTAFANLSNLLDKSASLLFPRVYDVTKTVASAIYNWIIGIIVSFYLIANKEKLTKQIKMFTMAYIPNNLAKKATKVLRLSHATFGKFIIGKLFDSFIVGVICFVGMSVLKMPYTLLISTVIGVTNVIPFFGPFIGAIPCVFILFIVDPVKSLWFCVFILILQQIDGNIIGPKILGNTVGVSGLWIMFSVIVGGSLLGIPGMIIGVPTFAVLYTLLAENIKAVCGEKGIEEV